MGEIVLVGSTGFVGGNLSAKGQFTATYHSTDVQQGFGKEIDLLIYAGVPAAMFLANQDPAADLAIMRTARENIRKLNAKKTVLISSICVFADSKGKTEADEPLAAALPAYGANRLQLEQWVRQDIPDALIVRLPALYGIGLKKNFLYDLHTITPAMLRTAKYDELAAISDLVRDGYADAQNGFYKLNGAVNADALRAFFAGHDFNALCFTDARSLYQFYDLRRLWADTQTALAASLTVLHLATPPCSAAEVYAAVQGDAAAPFTNTLAAEPFDYDLQTQHAALFGGADGYLCSKAQVLSDITAFMQDWN